MKRVTVVTIFLVVGVFVFAATGCAVNGSDGRLEDVLPTITVQGQGKVIAAPDEAVIRFGVSSEERTLNKAYKDNTAKMNRAIEAVKGLGVESKDIKTSSYNVTPIYPRDEKGYQLPGKPATYRVNQTLAVKIRDLSKVGEAIDKVMASGVNTFSGVSFISSKIEDLRDEAKVEAAKDAKEKARLMAESLGVNVGRVLRVGGSFVQPRQARNVMAFEAASMKAAPQIEAGSLEVSSQCQVVYEVIQ